MTVVIRARNGSFSFDSEFPSRILYDGLASGLALPHECATGTCGTCKAVLISGRIEKLWREAPGAARLKSAEHLLCQCAALEDCEFAIQSDVMLGGPNCRPCHLHGTLGSFRSLTHDVKVFSVELREPLAFRAGQFVALRVPGVEGFRCYSMTNHDSPAKRLDFVVKKKSAGALSDWLFEKDRSGTEVECFGPIGQAVFDEAEEKDILCVAGGSGIAGMMSILGSAAASGHFERNRGHVFFGVRRAEDAFFLGELNEMSAARPEMLTVTVALSEDDPPSGLRGEHPSIRFRRGFVHDVVATEMANRGGAFISYVAGPPVAVQAALKVLLLVLKQKAASIKYDKFG